MKELEKKALRIAKEIEGEDTQDLHLAEVGVASMRFFFFLFSFTFVSFYNLLFDFLFEFLKCCDFSQQERGLYHDDFDIDEETRFSSVYRVKGVDDSGCDEDEDTLVDSHNSETFGGIPGLIIKRSGEISGGKGNNGAQTWPKFSSMVSPQPVI